jgi:hypothetical protein
VPIVSFERDEQRQLREDDDRAAVASDTSSDGDSDASDLDDRAGSQGFGSGSDADSTSAFGFASALETGTGGSGADDLAIEVAAPGDGPSLSHGGTQLSGDASADVACSAAMVLHQHSPHRRRTKTLPDAQPWRCVFGGPQPGSRCDPTSRM